MAKSLQEQLMGAGLVDTKKAKSIKQEARKQRKQKGRDGLAADDQAKRARLEQERQAKAERDRELNERKQKEMREREIQAQIQQLIDVNRIRVEGDLGYQFVDGSKIRKIFVDEATQNALAKGRLAIVRQGDSYVIVVAPVADKIAQRDPKVVVYINDPQETQIDEDDPYKDYQIPDDLMW